MSAAREADAVTAILANAGVAVRRVDAVNLTLRIFLDIYSDDAFDLVWVASHGNYDHLAPVEVYLDLGSGERITMEDLTPPPTSGGRRLLVLNACDSGTHAVLGGLADIGLSAAAAGPTQGVVSHQWPIETWTAAPTFATVLAHGLVTDGSFFQAYCSTIALMRAGGDVLPSKVVDAVGASHPVAIRLEDHTEDVADLNGWGSAAFYQ